ncbi:MAG TPA: MutS family DNA mismatch repair protein [Syntrophomonadaceae bacterium]|nr:MutS family DNA mismatch repair protein [Syntrophomonadaceae bacterium]
MSVFQDDLNRLKVLEQSLLKKYNTISTLRLIVFLAGIAFVSLAIKTADSKYVYPALICLFLFVVFIIKHLDVQDKLDRTQCLMIINQNYINRLNGDWVKFDDCGNEFIDAQHPYASDLDIVGRNSLFQFISCASTFYGRDYLAELLKNPDLNISSIMERQGAIKEIAGKINFCREFQCEGQLREDSRPSPEKFILYSQSKAKLFKHQWVKWLFIFLPICTVVSLALSSMKIAIPAAIPVLLILVQIGINLAGGKKKRSILFEIYVMKSSLEAFRGLLHLIQQEDFQDNHLLNLTKELFNGGNSALLGLKKLDYIAGAADLKSNQIIHLIANTILLWDYHCIFALESWKEQYGNHIKTWLKVIGKFEAYISVAVIAQTSVEYDFPEFCTDDMTFMSQNLGHPLIIKEKMVANSIDIHNNICLITGSNMSGKTTMLRTIGINLVLAYAGAPVIAKRMRCSIMNVFTSMRIEDDLNSGISTFYAELLRIKMIVEFSLLKQPMIFLMDEILKGTNSKDRILGAKSVISNLNKKWIIGLVSSHDLELCDLENDDKLKIRNYHFTEHYIHDEIRFDYRIKSGRCNSTNAKHLMKLAGINLVE